MAFFFWIPTDRNPSDEASRVFCPEKTYKKHVQVPPAAEVTWSLPPGWATRERLFLHLCAGRRRPNDLCEYIE
eukprot:16128411-Heterocapsa_arctica.AAC.1